MRCFRFGQLRGQRSELRNELCKTGIFELGESGLDENFQARLLGAATEFFDLPDQRKLSIRRQRGTYRGYIPVTEFSEDAGLAPPVLYEAFVAGDDVAEDDPDIELSGGLLSLNLWLPEQQFLNRLYGEFLSRVSEIRTELLDLLEELIPVGATSLRSCFRSSLSNTAFLHYLPGRSPSADPLPHVDSSLFTLLIRDSVGGLQWQDSAGNYHACCAQPGGLVVMLGRLALPWSGGDFRPVPHRVLPPATMHRYSAACFVTPRHDTVVRAPEGRSCAPISASEAFSRYVSSFDVQ